MSQSNNMTQENYQLLFENMTSGCVYSRIITNKNGIPVNYRVMAVNKAYEKIIGKKSEVVVGRLITDIHPGVKNDSVDWIGIYGNVALRGEKWESEVYSEMVDIWMKITAYSPQKGDFVVTFDDITERKRLEEKNIKQITEYEKINTKMTEINERFNAFMDHVPVLVYIKDENLKHIYGNREILQYTNMDIENFIGTESSNFFPKKIASELEKQDQKILSDRVSIQMEEYIAQHDGTNRWFQDNKFPISLPDKRVHIGGFAVDITHLKNSQQKLEKALSDIKQLKNQLQAENISLKENLKQSRHFGEIIGESKEIAYVLHRVEQVAATDSTVLIIGETGVGKERFAQAVHKTSKRKDKPMIRIDCTTLSPNLIESELFGHEKGAFTGAVNKQVGRFELANGATIFLDEIAELPLEIQSRLLRVLQIGEFERVGGPKTIKTDVRIIAATNRNLEEEIMAGRFRQDLYYRLNVFPISIPPLCKRKEDIPLLVEYLLQIYNKRFGKKINTISKENHTALQEYAWPGNIRELENVIERAVITSTDNSLNIDLPQQEPDEIEEDIRTMEEVERNYITKILNNRKWRISGPKGAALALGLHPETLRSRMKKLGISRP
jgi:PAS domain S-box-containing protein